LTQHGGTGSGAENPATAKPGYWLTPREVGSTRGAETQLKSKAADLTRTKISEKGKRQSAE